MTVSAKLPDLDALVREHETTHRGNCGVCAFIEAQPLERTPGTYSQADWDALMAGPRKHVAIYRVMVDRFGFEAKSQGPVENHRKNHHRRVAS